jgi:hypothetical protein
MVLQFKCYDLRFPQQSTLLRKLGAQILTYPSVFTPVTGQAHWTTLLRARAIENQCYVIASAQVGKHNEKRSSYGHASVIDPWGRVIVDLEEKTPHVEIIDIDLDLINEVRENMPVTNSWRDDLYLNLPILKSKLEITFGNLINHYYEFFLFVELIMFLDFKEPIAQNEYTFGHVKLNNRVVFYETQYSIACVNIKPIVKGRK